MKFDMELWGFTQQFRMEAGTCPGYFAGRVVSQAKDLYRVITEQGELMAEVSGKLRFQAKSARDYPAVGDFVMLDRNQDGSGHAIVHHILARKSAFIRKAAGTSQDEQVVAANVDTVFICMSLNRDFNLRRLERYLSLTWDSGAMPVIILTKSDLCKELRVRLAEIDTVAYGVEVLVTSSLSGDGCAALKNYLSKGKTVAFMGSSGVGKSTLINRLSSGVAALNTQEIRNDDRGRHTTTRRELILLPDGGIVMDTPGMRELGIESADFEKAFSDIEALGEKCRFQDCTHRVEPGCAVQQAIADGSLANERLESYFKLKTEAAYSGLCAKEIEKKKFSRMFAEVGGMKNARKLSKAKGKH